MRELPGHADAGHPPDARRQLVERTITERALTAAARAAGLDKEEAVRRRIQRAEEQELQQAFLAREVAASVTDTALRARYDQESGKRQGDEEVRARHILVRTEPEAQAALAAVKGGEDFAAVAKRLSIDPGAKEAATSASSSAATWCPNSPRPPSP